MTYRIREEIKKFSRALIRSTFLAPSTGDVRRFTDQKHGAADNLVGLASHRPG